MPWLLCTLVLVTAFFAIRALASARSPQHLAEAHSGRWLAPVAASESSASGFFLPILGVGERGAVVGYFLYDLRWWWVIVLACSRALARQSSGRGAVRLRRSWDLRLVSGGAPLAARHAAVYRGRRLGRQDRRPNGFDNVLHGDEPKYLRYCEVWYQGHGLDVSSLALVRDQPLDARPALLQNGALLDRADPQDESARSPETFAISRASHRPSDGIVPAEATGLRQRHTRRAVSGICARHVRSAFSWILPRPVSAQRRFERGRQMAWRLD